MISVSMVWFCLKRMPRVLALIFNAVAIFLTIFLLVGCCNKSSESTFLVRYTFNQDSAFYSVIRHAFTKSLDGLEEIVIKSGYLGVCVQNVPPSLNNTSSTMCYPRKNLKQTQLYQDLSLSLSDMLSLSSLGSKHKSGGGINILELAELTSTKVIHPYVLEATIAMTAFMFIVMVYVTIPISLPFKRYINMFLLLLSSVLVLVWAVGATWTHIAIHAGDIFITLASLEIISVHKGRKASIMMWTSFAFLVLDCIILWILYLRDKKQLRAEMKNSNYSDKYSSESSHSYYSKN